MDIINFSNPSDSIITGRALETSTETSLTERDLIIIGSLVGAALLTFISFFVCLFCGLL